MSGIISYGAYIPKYRLTVDEIASVWGKDPLQIKKTLGISEKSVAAYDEDAVTVGFEAAFNCLAVVSFNPKDVEAVFVGSESHPYAVNPSSTIIADFLGTSNNYFASDLEFACKAATTALIFASSLTENKKIKYGLIVGTDCAQAKPHDILEYTAASAGAALLIGDKKTEIIADIVDYLSYSSDTPDFWRRDGVSYPSHGGRFTGERGYFDHIYNSSIKMLEKSKMKPADFDYCVFHMPNAKFPRDIARKLGFRPGQLSNSLIVDAIANPYSASSLLGLINVLENAKPDQYIFFSSYGSGAGSDSFIFKTTDNISKQQKNRRLAKMILSKKQISYNLYLKMRGKI